MTAGQESNGEPALEVGGHEGLSLEVDDALHGALGLSHEKLAPEA